MVESTLHSFIINRLRMFKNVLLFNRRILDFIGLFAVFLLAEAAWRLIHPLTFLSSVALLFVVYAAGRILFELTLNRNKVPSISTCFAGRRKIAALLKQDAHRRNRQDLTVFDLGSGYGFLANRIAHALPASHVKGFDIAPFPLACASFVQRVLGPSNLAFERADFFKTDCSDADAVVFYLTPSLAIRVGEKLDRELKPGSLVISHTFPVGGAWTPAETVRFFSPFKETLYVYRKN